MKIVKITGIVLALFAALILVLGMIQPSHFEYEQSITINAPKEIVFNKINNLKHWEQWEPWIQRDSTMKRSFGEKVEGLGANYSWVGDPKISGSGKLTIAESNAPTYVATALDFDGQGGGEGYFKIEDAEGGGALTSWGFSFDVPFPFNAFTIFTAGAMEKEMNSMFEEGLSNLKNICEAQAANTYRGFEIKTIDFKGKAYIGVLGNVKISPKSFEEFFTKSFTSVAALLSAGKMEMDGAPSGLYYDWNEVKGMTNMAAAMPIKSGMAISGGNFVQIELPAAKCLMIDYYGGYTGTREAHLAIEDYLKEKGLQKQAPMMEEYVTDPGTEPDSSKWLTRIYYFLK